MAKRKRFAPRTLSTPTQIQGNASTISESASHASAHSEPVVPTISSIPSISVASQSPQTAHSFDQNDNLTEVNSPIPQPAHKKNKSERYWTVDVIGMKFLICI